MNANGAQFISLSDSVGDEEYQLAQNRWNLADYLPVSFVLALR
jgi:hypothetical protein